MLLGAISLLAAGWLLAGPWVALAFGAAAPSAARAVLHARLRRRAAALAAGTPAIARALADALAGGHSVRGALEPGRARRRRQRPRGERLRAAAAALELGERTEDVLLALAGGRRPAILTARSTRSPQPSCCNATPAAISPACCASSPYRSRSVRASSPTRAR